MGQLPSQCRLFRLLPGCLCPLNLVPVEPCQLQPPSLLATFGSPQPQRSSSPAAQPRSAFPTTPSRRGTVARSSHSSKFHRSSHSQKGPVIEACRLIERSHSNTVHLAAPLYLPTDDGESDVIFLTTTTEKRQDSREILT
jgi:hypothetical protein